MSEIINIQLTPKQCDLIALALDSLSSKGKLNELDSFQANELFYLFDTLSSNDVKDQKQKITKPQLVYDRDSNIRPLFPK